MSTVTACVEIFGSRRAINGVKPSIDVDWDVYGTDDIDAIMYAAANAIVQPGPSSAYAPTLGFYDGMPQKQVGPAKQLGPGHWTVPVHYEADQLNRQTNDLSEQEFDTAGGRTHIVTGLAPPTIYGPDSTSLGGTGVNGAIGWDGQNVAGTDVVIPAFAFTRRAYFPFGYVTNDYLNTLYQLTGQYNNAIFKGFPIGSVLFLGAQGAQRGWGDWQISYKFEAQQALNNVTIGGIGGISKMGQQYIWFRYVKDGSSGFAVVPKPSGAYVETVYLPGDFSELGIGTM